MASHLASPLAFPFGSLFVHVSFLWTLVVAPVVPPQVPLCLSLVMAPDVTPVVALVVVPVVAPIVALVSNYHDISNYDHSALLYSIDHR